MQSKVLCMMTHNHQQDAHEPLLEILDILHNHTKIDLLLGLLFLQEAMKQISVIRNTFYGIINSTHTLLHVNGLPLYHLTYMSLR